MASDFIKEFLIGIGIAFDDAGLKKYKDATDSAAKGAKKVDDADRRLEKEEQARLKRRTEARAQFSKAVVAQGVLIADALEAAAKAVGQAVSGIASGFEQIYYSSQRTGASIGNLRGVAYAVGQLGGSYEGALQSVEAFAKQMRTNPGYGAMVRSLGVATEANGKLRDTTDVLTDLGNVFAGKEYYIGFQYAQALGIDEQTYRALRDQPEALRRYKEEYARTAKTVGLNSEEAARNSKEFMQSLRSLGTFITTAAEKLLSDLAPALKGVIDQFLAYVAANPDLVQRTIRAIGEAAKFVGELLKEMAVNGRAYFTTFVEKVGEWNKEGGLIDTMGKVALAIERIVGAVGRAIQWLRDLDRATEMKGLKDIARFLGWVDGKTAPVVQQGLSQIGATDRATDAFSGSGIGSAQASDRGGGGAPPEKKSWWKRHAPTWLGGEPASNGGSSGAGGTNSGGDGSDDVDVNGKKYKYAGFTGSGRGRINSWLRFLQTSVSDGGLGMPLNRARVVVAMMQGESGENLNPKAIGDSGTAFGTAQWRLDRAAALRATAARMGTDWTDVSAQQRHLRNEMLGKYNKVYKEILNAPSDEAALYAGIRRFENPAQPELAAKFRQQHLNRLQKYGLTGDGDKGPTTASFSPDKLADTMNKYDFSQSKPGTVPLGASSNDNSVSNSLVLAPKTEIHVNGGADPSATASAVAGAQNNVNSMSLRNARSAMR